MKIHIPVLQKEIIEYLDPHPNENFIDCTIGGAGHTFKILEKSTPRGKVLGIDWTPEILEELRKEIRKSKLKERVILVCDNFAHLERIVKYHKFGKVKGILFDLGMSSWHLEESGRGFSFQKEELLDMRYNPYHQRLSAQEIINRWSKEQIEKLLREYGEEKFAPRIAERIVKERKKREVNTTFQLVEIIRKTVPIWYQKRRIHFATKTFQALRIAVNDEINNLKKALSQSERILNAGGRLVVVSFHSLEDRVVKNFFKEKGQQGLFKILTKKPVVPTQEEIKINPRARSAKLRAGVKLI